MKIKKEEKVLCVMGIICALGCMAIAVYNTMEATYYGAEIIRRSDYFQVANVGEVSKSDSVEADALSGTVNINTASAEELAENLPGIGLKKAKSIVEYREAAGGFDSVDELINVKGIGEKTLKNIRPYCRVKD